MHVCVSLRVPLVLFSTWDTVTLFFCFCFCLENYTREVSRNHHHNQHHQKISSQCFQTKMPTNTTTKHTHAYTTKTNYHRKMRYNRIIGLRKNYDIGGELICGNDRALFQHSPIDEPDSDNGANDGNIGIGIDRRKKRISRWNSTRKQMKKQKKKEQEKRKPN